MSSETPKPNPKKTKSARRNIVWAGGLLLVVLVLGAISAIGARDKLSWDGPPMDVLRLGGKTYTLEVARSEAAREKGLGSRLVMDKDAGMLFLYQNEAQRCFWMKDMRFPLDIIWVAASKKVTHIEAGVSPLTYPKTYCYSGQYVIELNAGQTVEDHLAVGRTLDF